MPTAAVLRLAGILDEAGFGLLEVSGGGVFDSAVRRGVESPWERIRAIHARTSTPLGMALRGRFLVGSRPVDGDFVRRFVASAAENGIEVFRLHDPLNDVSNLREAAEAIDAAGREFDAGLVYSRGKTGETDELVEQARKLPELGAARIVLHDPTGSLQPHRAQELVTGVGEASGLPVGVYCQGAAGNALAAALEAGEPPLAAPIGQLLASQALLHVLSARRYQTVVDELRALLTGGYGTPPGPIDPTVRRAVELLAADTPEEPRVALSDVREEAAGLASSEEELLLLGLFGDEAEALIQTVRARSGGEDVL